MGDGLRFGWGFFTWHAVENSFVGDGAAAFRAGRVAGWDLGGGTVPPRRAEPQNRIQMAAPFSTAGWPGLAGPAPPAQALAHPHPGALVAGGAAAPAPASALGGPKRFTPACAGSIPAPGCPRCARWAGGVIAPAWPTWFTRAAGSRSGSPPPGTSAGADGCGSSGAPLAGNAWVSNRGLTAATKSISAGNSLVICSPPIRAACARPVGNPLAPRRNLSLGLPPSPMSWPHAGNLRYSRQPCLCYECAASVNPTPCGRARIAGRAVSVTQGWRCRLPGRTKRL